MHASPWLDITADEYAAHMSAPQVGQRQVLDDIMAAALQSLRPHTLLVAGCGPGGGWEYIDAEVTRSVTGVDIHPAYLEKIRNDYGQRLVGMELHCGDILTAELPRARYDLIIAALLFEYIDMQQGLSRLREFLSEDGTLLVVLQLQSANPAVSETPLTSIRRLSDVMTLVSPENLVKTAAAEGLSCVSRRVVPLPGKKAFLVLFLESRKSMADGAAAAEP
jgi:cyclopropane fatty-acyl-phospholipid synthase-like methyltransferase